MEFPGKGKYEERIVAWAQGSDRIRTIIVVGSQARADHPADRWSDLDLMIYATAFDDLISDNDWLSQIGQVWARIPHQTGDGDPELLVLFEAFFKVDFVFYLTTELERIVHSGTLPQVYRRGYYPIVDKDNLVERLPSPAGKLAPEPIPSQEQFLQLVETFWYGTVYVAKQLWRKDLWIVKYRDWTLKEQLLTMIEWHAQSKNGWEYDTWHDGRFLPEWTDAQTLNELHNSFAHFNAGDSWRALLSTMRLFRRLAHETAAVVEYDYPSLLDQRATRFVESISPEND